MGVFISIALAAAIFHLASSHRTGGDSSSRWDWSGTVARLTGAGCVAASALVAMAGHLVLSTIDAMVVFFMCGLVLTIASPWLIFRRG